LAIALMGEPLFAIGSRTMASALPRPPRRSSLQPESFAKDAPPLPPGAPLRTALPDRTRHALAGLVTRMPIAPASVPAMVSEDHGDDF
jgi:hypothetical protein